MECIMKETELCLGMPGGGKATGKRGFHETVELKLKLKLSSSCNETSFDSDDDVNGNKIVKKEKKINIVSCIDQDSSAKPPAKAQVVGWPPVRSYRKNIMTQKIGGGEGDQKATASTNGGGAMFVKVSMDGAPYLRKVDLNMYKSYQDLSDALAKMFSSFTMGDYGTQGMIDFMNESKLMDLLNSSEYVPSYQDKDGDWMLVGDVPWQMFVDSCKRLRIMKGSEAAGLGTHTRVKMNDVDDRKNRV